MAKQTITAKTFVEFMNVIAALVEAGITFDADAHYLTIELTGGY
jgi:hypothetical protein